MEKTFKIIKSNQQPSTSTMFTMKSWPQNTVTQEIKEHSASLCGSSLELWGRRADQWVCLFLTCRTISIRFPCSTGGRAALLSEGAHITLLRIKFSLYKIVFYTRIQEILVSFITVTRSNMHTFPLSIFVWTTFQENEA